ncbi:MAG: P-II family nitrogen regulator [Chloroflexi bacterium]|nr:P-II family nitrogen regulator [Chloroflexota bacterium]
MKEVKAIIQPFMLSKVVDALQAVEGLPGVTVSEVKGFGHGRAKDAGETVVEGDVEYAKKAKLEIVVPDHLLDAVLDVVKKEAHTGRPGDGLIFVSTVNDVIRIRTGQRETYP